MPDFEIRPAISSDVRAIAGLHLLSWKTAYAGLLPDSLLDFDPADPATIESSAKGWAKTLQSFPGNLAIAINGSQAAVGFCCAGPVEDVKKNAPCQFQIYGLHVRPENHGEGIGTALLEHAFQRMARLEMNKAIVWTLRDLEQSRRFYEHRGGTLEKRGVWELTGQRLEEVAYGWVVS